MAEQETQYKCDICGAVFRDAESLTKHMPVHDTGKTSKEDLQQGTQKPTQNPSMPGQSPSPGPSPTI
jgi:hypothetical protein